MLHEELYSPIPSSHRMMWDESKQEYIGTLLDGRRIHVSGDVWSEQISQGAPERALENPITWEPDIDGEKVYVEDRRMGRPSQGRRERLQINVTPEIASWLESMRSPDDKSISDIVFHLLEGIRQSK